MDFHCSFTTPLRPNMASSSASSYSFNGLASTPQRPVYLSPSFLQSATRPGINASPVFPGFTSPLGYSPSYLSPVHQQQPLDLSYSVEKLKQPSALPTTSDSFYLQRLKSNPMFQDLQSLLVQECLHMKVPTNLINASWNSTPLTVPGVIDNGANVYSLHLKLQERLLSLRTNRTITSKALEIESDYSCQVGKIEVARYQGLCSAGTSEKAKQEVNTSCDKKRLDLLKQVHSDVDRILNFGNTDDSGMFNVSSSSSQCSSQSGSDRCSPDIPSHDSGILSDDSLPEFPTKSSKNVDMPSTMLDNCKTDSSAVRHLNFANTVFLDSSETFQCGDNLKTVTSSQSVCTVESHDSVGISTSKLDLKTHKDSGIVRKHSNSDQNLVSEENSNSQMSEEKLETSSHDNRVVKKISGDSRNRLLTPEATVVLTYWYDDHVRYPYPSELEVEQLSKDSGLSEKQVKKWMANKRVRCYNTLSISGNQHPIKLKYKGKNKQQKENLRPNYQQLSNESRDILTRWYEEHCYDPYPSEEEKEELAEKCQVSVTQVRSWFANKRSRAHNTRKQIPNYFIEKYPEYTPHVQMVSMQREHARRKIKKQESHMDFFYQNNYYM